MFTRHSIVAIALCLLAVAPSLARAQSADLSNAVLSLPSRTVDGTRIYNDARLFSGLVTATIVDNNGNPNDFRDNDTIVFRLNSRTASGLTLGFGTPFTRQQFEEWAQGNAKGLLDILFPGGLSAAAAGRDVGALYSQQLLLTTILDVNDVETNARPAPGGLIESEWLRRDTRQTGDSTWGIQGTYPLTRSVSLQGRFGRQREALNTSSTNFAVDYHPFVQRGTTTIVRVGASARSGFLYASSTTIGPLATDPIRVGSIDVAGGGWASARRRVGPVTLGGGGLLQGTKSYMPPGDEGTFRAAFAHALNDRGIAYDLTVGGTARYDATHAVSLIGRVAETYSLDDSTDRPAMHTVLGGVMYVLAPGASLDFGYRVTSFGDTLGQSVYFQGRFGW